jgi:hypothetical protein
VYPDGALTTNALTHGEPTAPLGRTHAGRPYQCSNGPMPLPLYAPPAFRRSPSPNPFARTHPARLRMLVDRPLLAGQVDGEGEFQGYPFLGGGSTGYPDSATVLRSYLGHPALEVMRLGDELNADGDVVLGEPDPVSGRDTFSFQVKTDTGTRYTGIDHYGEAEAEAATFASKYGIGVDEGLDGALLHRVGAELEVDLVVTGRDWLLNQCGRPYGGMPTSIVSPDEALALIGLYLRWHSRPVIIGGAAARWHPTSMRHSAAYTSMPAFERWNQSGRRWHDRSPDGDLTLENLNRTLLTRVSRTFRFRDGVFALSVTMAGHEPEEMLCELDSLLFSLVGAFDVAARITDFILHMGGGRAVGWQYTGRGGWQTRIEPLAKDLYDYTAVGSEMQRTFQVLRWLRNSVHNEALNLTTDDQEFYVTFEAETQNKFREFLREGHAGWSSADLGIRVQPPGGATAGKWLPGVGRHSVTVRRAGAPRPADPLQGELVVEVRQLINKMFPTSLIILNQIIQLTPLNDVPGYGGGLDNPSRVSLPWQLSDTTGHRLRFLYGVTELT